MCVSVCGCLFVVVVVVAALSLTRRRFEAKPFELVSAHYANYKRHFAEAPEWWSGRVIPTFIAHFGQAICHFSI